jgi:antitoxin CptB
MHADASATGSTASRPLDASALGKLRWRCRRGLLENDLLLERFFARPEPVSEDDAGALALLMELADNDLLDIFLGRSEPPPELDRPDVRRVVAAVRTAR